MKATTHAFITFTISCIFLIAPLMSANAQSESSAQSPSDAELEQFVEVDLALREIRRDRQKKVMEKIKSSSLGMKGYRKASTKQGKEGADLSEEKQAEYEDTKEKVESIQAEYRNRQREKIKEMGMEPSRYQEISAMKNDKKIREKMISIREEKMEAAQED